MSVQHVPIVSCGNLSKLINSSARYQNSSDMRFLLAGRLYFNHDVFSRAMVLLIIFLSKTRINSIYVNILFTLINFIYVINVFLLNLNFRSFSKFFSISTASNISLIHQKHRTTLHRELYQRETRTKL